MTKQARADLSRQVAAMNKQFMAQAKKERSGLESSMGEYCQYLANECKKEMTNAEVDTSRTYHKTHHPSVPGSAPAVDYGVLRASIQYETSETESGARGVVGSTKDYGAYLENGTSTIQPRPWLGPGLETTKETLKSVLKANTEGRVIDVAQD